MSSKPTSRISRSGGIIKTTPAKSQRRSQSNLPPKPSSQVSAKKPKNLEYAAELGELDTSANMFMSSQGTGKKSKPTTSGRKRSGEAEEKRLRRIRTKAPGTFLQKLERAQTQRMIVLGRKRTTVAGAPAEDIDVVGSTGNIYTVTISHLPSCTCPDSLKGNECKHKVYVLHNVLKAPAHLQYQLAFLTSELEDIFTGAPPIPTDLAEDSKGNRKPTDGECPICYMDLEEKQNKLVWCKAQCGHNLHKSCFDQWAQSQAGKEVRCVYCRTPWETDVADAEAIRKAGEEGEDGYVNVASQFGISRARDYNGYYQPWARRQFGVGW